jgi:hypothetical protein
VPHQIPVLTSILRHSGKHDGDGRLQPVAAGRCT